MVCYMSTLGSPFHRKDLTTKDSKPSSFAALYSLDDRDQLKNITVMLKLIKRFYKY